MKKQTLYTILLVIILLLGVVHYGFFIYLAFNSPP